MTRLALALAAALAMNAGLAPSASAQTSDPNHEIGEPLWIAGLSVFAATYVITGATATTLRLVTSSREDRIWQSWIPLAGPFIMLADSAGFDDTQYALTIVSAVLQVLGLGAFVTGVVLDAQPDPVEPAPGAIVVLPTAGPDSVGLTLVGRF